MKKAFIITRYATDNKHAEQDNLDTAKYACYHTEQAGFEPVCPRLQPSETDITAMMQPCDIVRQYGASVDAEMAAQLEIAEKLGKSVEIFNSIGIPKADWNGEKFKNDPEYQALCAEAGRPL